MTMLRKEDPHVVILGGGFGGLSAARALRRAPVRITLIDRSNHHLFQPLLYQVATAALSAPDIASPIRKLVRSQANTTVLMAEVTAIDVADKRVRLSDGVIAYDYLIVATGMTNAYFGHDEWEKHAPGLKTLAEALEIRARVLRAFERAEREPDPVARRALTTFVVIGGGPTGVELAGALAEIAGRTLAKDFRHFDPTTTRVVLIEAGKRLLPTFAPESSESAKKSLERIGVEVRLGSMVTAIDEGVVQMGADSVRASTMIWAAGVRASPLTKGLPADLLDRSGRVKVSDDLSVPGHPDVFILGDLIAKTQDGQPLPGVAQLALQSGRHAAETIRRSLRGETRLPFVYKDKGSMATIGRAKAVAEVGRLKLAGFFAWMLWLFIHVMFLVEFRNRLAVLFDWAYAYLTWQRSSRVILELPANGSDAPGRAVVPSKPDGERARPTTTTQSTPAPAE